MVIEALLDTAFGVSVMAPVVGLSESPGGSEPLVIDHDVDAPPVLVGELVPTFWFFVNVNGDAA